jgi:ketosteroid isomerase-like protein
VSEATVARVREAYALLRRGDPRDLLELIHPDAVWRAVDGREQHGTEAVAKTFLWLGAMHRLRAGEVIDLGDRVVVAVSGRRMNRLGSSSWLGRRIYQVVVVRDGKLVEVQDYPDRKAAFAAVGLGGSTKASPRA